MNIETTKRPFFAPNIGQHPGSSSGLNALQVICAGYGISVNHAGQVEGEQGDEADLSPEPFVQRAVQLGLGVERTMMPIDHLLLLETSDMPVVVMMRPIELEAPHWVVIWSRVGPLWQVMDPRFGRRWLTGAQLATELVRGELEISADAWKTLSRSERFRFALRKRLAALGIEPDQINAFIETALVEAEAGTRKSSPEASCRYEPLTVLDAAIRLMTHLVQRKAVQHGASATQILDRFWRDALKEPPGARCIIPAHHWSVTPFAGEERDAPRTAEKVQSTDEEMRLHFSGCEVLRVWEQRQMQAADARDETVEFAGRVNKTESSSTRPDTPKPSLFDYLLIDGARTPVFVGVATVLAAAGVFFQAILFRSVLNLGGSLTTLSQRFWTMGLILVFMLTLAVLEWFRQSGALTMGQRLDVRLRLAGLAVIPGLSDQYFRRFSASDLISELHSVRAVNQIPLLTSWMVFFFLQFIFTIAGLIWVDWLSALLALLKVGVSAGVMSANALMRAEHQRARTYQGFLSRFHLDTMLGLVAVRTHSAERTTQREFEGHLTRWRKAHIAVSRKQLWIEVADYASTYGLIALIILLYVTRGGSPINLLLLAYWSLSLDQYGEFLLFLIFRYFRDQSIAIRYLDLLSAPQERELVDRQFSNQAEGLSSQKEDNRAQSKSGVALGFQQVAVQIDGQMVLRDINLTIEAGGHVAIVGPSGAGKSTLVGLLLGRHYPSGGTIWIDGEPLNYERLQQLRQETAWVDPGVQLWNRPFLDNLRYGGNGTAVNQVIDAADLQGVLERLPDGMQTPLGGEGRLVAGGEGQRVRFGRAMQRKDARLVILDEPFRGLDREKRRLLLNRAREFWPAATLLCATHDVGQTQDFDRVLVVEDGRIVEDGEPSDLFVRPVSRYRTLLEAEEAVRQTLWGSDRWRRLWLENGRLTEVSK